MRAAVVVLTGLLFASAGVSHAGFIILEDSRYVSVDGGPPIRPVFPGASSFDAVANGVTVTSIQHSSLASSGLAGMQGEGSVVTSDEFALGSSIFDIRFEVDAPTSFNFLGHISESDSATAFFADSTGVIRVLSGGFSVTGQLLPSLNYRIFLGLTNVPDEIPGAGGSWYFAVVTPEPSELGLTILAVTAVLTLVSSRSRSRTALRSETARSPGSLQ